MKDSTEAEMDKYKKKAGGETGSGRKNSPANDTKRYYAHEKSKENTEIDDEVVTYSETYVALVKFYEPLIKCAEEFLDMEKKSGSDFDIQLDHIVADDIHIDSFTGRKLSRHLTDSLSKLKNEKRTTEECLENVKKDWVELQNQKTKLETETPSDLNIISEQTMLQGLAEHYQVWFILAKPLYDIREIDGKWKIELQTLMEKTKNMYDKFRNLANANGWDELPEADLPLSFSFTLTALPLTELPTTLSTAVAPTPPAAAAPA
eukprot:3035314-Rhodomonas_salina.1